MTAVKAIYEDGVFNPKEPVQLEERTDVEVLIPTPAAAAEDPTGWKAMRAELPPTGRPDPRHRLVVDGDLSAGFELPGALRDGSPQLNETCLLLVIPIFEQSERFADDLAGRPVTASRDLLWRPASRTRASGIRS